MKLLPDPHTARIDPFRAQKTLNMNFFVHDPFTREPYSRDPRNIAAKAEEYLDGVRHRRHRVLRRRGRVLHLRLGAVRVDPNSSYYYIDSVEGCWNTGRDEEGGNKGYKVAYKGGYFPVPPVDHYADLRDDDGHEPDRAGFERRARPPRGRHRRSGRDQLQVQHAAARRPTR